MNDASVAKTLKVALAVMATVVVVGAYFGIGYDANYLPESPQVSKGKIFYPPRTDDLRPLTEEPDDAVDSTPGKFVKASLVTAVTNRFRIREELARHIVSQADIAAKQEGLPVALVLAVIARESSFDPSAVNNQDVGLMQVNTRWHADKIEKAGGIKALFNPGTNIRLGTRILAQYINAAGGSLAGGLRRYNGLDKTNNYPQEVLGHMKVFQAFV